MGEYPNKFRCVLDYVIEKCFDKRNQILKNRRTMEKFINKKANAEKYGARIDCEGFTFIINFYPTASNYDAFIYCYITEYLDEHLKKSSKGIRFVDSKYNALFCIEDGGRIIITEPNGKFHSEDCRYLDDYHFETVRGSIFHIHEFAEYLDKIGNTVKPQGEVI